MVYMYHSFLIHSSADGHLGCFHVLAIINCVQHFLNHPLSTTEFTVYPIFFHSHLSWIWKVKMFVENRWKVVLRRSTLTFANCCATLSTPFSDMQSSRERWQHSPHPCDWLSDNLRGSVSISGLCLLEQEAQSLLALTLPIRMWLVDCSELDIWPKWRKQEYFSWKLQFII